MTEATATVPGQPDRSVSRVVILAWLALVVAVLVLLIDQQIKRQIVFEGEKALKLLVQAQKLAREADSGGPEPAGEASASPGDSVNSGHGVDDAAGTSAEPGGNARSGLDPEAGRVARPFGGPRGDG